MTAQPARQLSLIRYDVVRSTNESVLAAGREGLPEGTIHLARQQTGGRGRGDHRWWSPRDGGLWMSVLLRPHTDPQRWGGLTLVAAAALFDEICARGVADLRLYWPNDLQVGLRKLGGLLGEVGSAGKDQWVALGVGVNLTLDAAVTGEPPPEELRDQITSLAESGATGPLDAPSFALAFLERLWPLYDEFQEGASVAKLVGDRLAHRSGWASVSSPGKPERRGVIVGLGPLGELLLSEHQADTHTKKSPHDPRESGPGGLSDPAVLSIVSGDVVYEDGEPGSAE